MINVDKLSYSYPQKDLYDKISFTIENGQHCAFIGSSGSGKSTLINIIMGTKDYMYDGELEVETTRKIGYVSQFSQLDSKQNSSVFEYIAEDFLLAQKKIDEICDEMEKTTDLEFLLEKYQVALDYFDSIGGNDYESEINKKLNLSNLMIRKDLNINELSGGEFKLAQVIKEMMNSPELIIMDEPDVFLDFENLNSLRKLINNHKGTLIIITHNRYLLDHCFNKIIHLENMKLKEFDGKYIEYNFELLQNKIEHLELSLADDEEMLRNEIMINKLRYIATNNSESSKGKSLKARIKIQERLEKNRTEAPFVDIKKPSIDFCVDNPIEEDELIIEVNNYSAQYDEILIDNANFEIGSKDKVALIGANGTGKTTLFRDLIANNKESIKLHQDLEIGYLSQIQGEVLDESNAIKDEFFDIGFKTLEDIEYFLYDFGFDEESLEQRISSLSGGEKNIIQLAKLTHTNSNLLLLDEPTSHLDMYSQIALDEAIDKYPGAVLMISHDYYSIVNNMDYVLIIDDKNIRKMSMRKFRKMIYSSHFDKNYLEMEQNKKTVETKIASALQNDDFELAKVLSEELDEIIKLL